MITSMATKTLVLLVDDITEEPADTTVSFGLDGTAYEIDLTDKNATELRDAFAKYVSAARKMGKPGRGRAAASQPAKTEVDPAAVRAWAASRGITVNARGRLSKDVVEKFRAAGN
jgi:uncharacterized protein (DUF4415 family)